MSEQEVTDQVLTFLVAGHETTSNALSWTFYLLSQHPDVERKLRDEVVRWVTVSLIPPRFGDTIPTSPPVSGS